ncbi:MAG: hypothetical protein Q7T04_04120, partial [Dehalococcoidia bacterium]|nr:hypothetical protein [Dehalococcoidia bacterium]
MAGLPPFAEALLKPQAYPHLPQKVELVQTQVSFVFLTGDYVYKVKKPVNFGFLDFTSLEKRRYYCGQEVLLNSRLCPGIYLGVVKVCREDASFTIETQGEAVEYAVKMRQLPRERMLDYLLRHGNATPQMLEKVAGKLVEFHRKAETNPGIARFGGMETARTNTEENFGQTEKYIDITVSRDRYDVIRAYSLGFLERNVPLFEKRMREGRIRDCHGDLHAAHVCLTDDICIIDCIEFNDRFRYSDVAGDVSFLAMDLDYNGRSDLSR